LANTAKTAGAIASGSVLDALAQKLGIAAEGVRFVLLLLIPAIAFALLGFRWLTLVPLLAAFAIALFFRDPERRTLASDVAVVSGADGKVCAIDEGAPPGLGQDRQFRRVSVFMSPLDVHINRAPVTGEVVAVKHTAGEFRAAYSDHASELNERNLVLFKDGAGRYHAMVQVAGYLARRIVCRLRPHDRTVAGQRIGLIMFGSRVDHFLPSDYRVTVSTGQRVRAGETIIGELVQ
jgi:phosphatidylserine decarboxylase